MRISFYILMFVFVFSSFGLNQERPIRNKASQQPTDDEIRAAQEVARKFESRLLSERDFEGLIGEFFVNDFLSHFENEASGFPIAVFKKGSALRFSKRDRERYYVLFMNNYYYSMQYQSTVQKSSQADDSQDSADRVFPPEVYDVLTNDHIVGPYLRNRDSDYLEISTEKELRTAIAVLEVVVKKMKEYLVAHPPEKAQLYKENLSEINRRDAVMKPWFRECSAPCYGYPSGTRLTTINIPFLQMVLVGDKDSLKVLSVAPYMN